MSDEKRLAHIPSIPERIAKLLASANFRRGAASVRELDAAELRSQGRFAEADKQLRIATELNK